MKGLLASLNPLFIRYKSEVVLLGIAFAIGATSLLLFLSQKSTPQSLSPSTKTEETRTVRSQQTITVDISGAVKRPFVYSFRSSARIIDAIQKAGGLTEDADEPFVRRNINYARLINDQEKIYIPFLSDTANGFVLENKRIIDFTQPNMNTAVKVSSSLININVASEIELDQLPGIGKVTAEAIINGRPYTSLDDLVKNTVIKQSVFDKIKDLISVY